MGTKSTTPKSGDKPVKPLSKAVLALQKFIAESVERGPMTVHDHLIESGYNLDYNDYRRMRAATSRALGNDPAYADLRGTIFRADTRKSNGFAPPWTVGLPAQDSKHPMPDFLGTTAMIAVKGAIRHIDDPEANARAVEGMNRLAHMSKRVQEAAMLTAEALDETLTRRDMVIAAQRETIAAKDVIIEREAAARADKDTIIALLSAGAGNSLVQRAA